jgi:hypothetical protein
MRQRKRCTTLHPFQKRRTTKHPFQRCTALHPFQKRCTTKHRLKWKRCTPRSKRVQRTAKNPAPPCTRTLRTRGTLMSASKGSSTAPTDHLLGSRLSRLLSSIPEPSLNLRPTVPDPTFRQANARWCAPSTKFSAQCVLGTAESCSRIRLGQHTIWRQPICDRRPSRRHHSAVSSLSLAIGCAHGNWLDDESLSTGMHQYLSDVQKGQVPQFCATCPFSLEQVHPSYLRRFLLPKRVARRTASDASRYREYFHRRERHPALLGPRRHEKNV